MSGAKADARAAIQTAFGGTHPPDERVAIGQADPECQEVERGLRGRAWETVGPQDVRRYADALPLLTPAAFRYYLPAYMIACLDARPEIDVAWDNVISSLTPPGAHHPKMQSRFVERTEAFTAAQKRAIHAFLAVVDREEQDDWAAMGMTAPEDRVARALAYWSAQA